jgi:hypothetical protein
MSSFVIVIVRIVNSSNGTELLHELESSSAQRLRRLRAVLTASMSNPLQSSVAAFSTWSLSSIGGIAPKASGLALRKLSKMTSACAHGTGVSVPRGCATDARLSTVVAPSRSRSSVSVEVSKLSRPASTACTALRRSRSNVALTQVSGSASPYDLHIRPSPSS